MVVYETIPFKVMDSGTYALARTLAYQLVNVYALRMVDAGAPPAHKAFSLLLGTCEVRLDETPRKDWLTCAT
jgi:hypothetical protein